MDRISALRNVEEALSEFKAGESDLATMERRVRGVRIIWMAMFRRLQ